MHYPYTDNDNLQTPLTYQYSKFAGVDFISSWRLQRQQIIFSASAVTLPSLTLEDDTSAFLVPVTEKLRLTHTVVDEELQWPLRLLKKFEVTKRLYASYSDQPPFKRQSDDFYGLHNYLLLAEISVRMWQLEQKSYWLSGLLKLTDTLCTQFSKMSVDQQNQLAWVVEQEQKVLTILFEEREICC